MHIEIMIIYLVINNINFFSYLAVPILKSTNIFFFRSIYLNIQCCILYQHAVTPHQQNTLHPPLKQVYTISQQHTNTPSNTDPVVYGSNIHKHTHYCILIYCYFDIDLNKEDREKKNKIYLNNKRLMNQSYNINLYIFTYLVKTVFYFN